MEKPKTKPGFVRVFIKDRNRTIQIREFRAKDQNFLTRNGMILMPEPQMPVTSAPVTPLAPEPVTKTSKPKTNG